MSVDLFELFIHFHHSQLTIARSEINHFNVIAFLSLVILTQYHFLTFRIVSNLQVFCLGLIIIMCFTRVYMWRLLFETEFLATENKSPWNSKWISVWVCVLRLALLLLSGILLTVRLTPLSQNWSSNLSRQNRQCSR